MQAKGEHPPAGKTTGRSVKDIASGLCAGNIGFDQKSTISIASKSSLPPCSCRRCLVTKRSNSLASNFLAVFFSCSRSLLSLRHTNKNVSHSTRSQCSKIKHATELCYAWTLNAISLTLVAAQGCHTCIPAKAESSSSLRTANRLDPVDLLELAHQGR